MKSMFDFSRTLGLLLVSVLVASCESFEKVGAQDSAIIGLVMGDHSNSDLLGSSGHLKGDTLVYVVADHQLVFYCACTKSKDRPSVKLLDVSGRNAALSEDATVWNKHKAGAGLFCALHSDHGVKRFYSDLSVDSSLVFVLDEEKKRLQFFMGKRPDRFPYDINVVRKRLNENWDLVLSGF